MTRTPGSYVAFDTFLGGILTPRNRHGLSHFLSGWPLGAIPEVDEPEDEDVESEEGAINTDPDKNGIPRLISAHVRDVRFVEIRNYVFANPNRDFTGYAANGFWYTDGVIDPSHVPFKATWATEGEGPPTTDRGDLDRFPDRIFIVTTKIEVVILNADDLTVWMRFNLYTAPHPTGTLLGDTDTTLRQADFANGFLVVATEQGLRIADFTKDRGYFLGRVLSRSSSTGLVNRNLPAYTHLNITGMPGVKTVLNNNCLCVSVAVKSLYDAQYKNNVTVAAVGHPDGLSGVRLSYPEAVPNICPQVNKHSMSLWFGNSWYAVDDGDGDMTTPTIKTVSSPPPWSGKGILPGDKIVTDALTEHTIVTVGADRLELFPEILCSLSGLSFTITREVPEVETEPGAMLFFASGVQQITYVDSEAWYDGAIFGGSDFLTSFSSARLSTQVEKLSDMALFGDNIYIATDMGVFFVTKAMLDTVLAQSYVQAEFRYSIKEPSFEGATFLILEGDFDNCSAVAVDPETGHVAVATSGAGTSVITEIDTSIQQAFRYFSKRKEVTVIATYRNPEGPPDEEAS